ncbi:hypothetical protein BDFB_014592 [Asbolus verrucosus]|uniref:Transposase Tc1-like domain-containing protein n=1 Tax=Asbolus verrucosus TaxID=1661398 RepID=A0A482VVK0_ASBVE|nr:hypothetical protein BDFB_014592 [Asbolus verrucosus]
MKHTNEGQSRKRATNIVEDRFLRLNALQQRFFTARKLQTELAVAHNRNIHVQAVRNRLKEHQLTLKISAKGTLLTRGHRRARVHRRSEERYVQYNIQLLEVVQLCHGEG